MMQTVKLSDDVELLTMKRNGDLVAWVKLWMVPGVKHIVQLAPVDDNYQVERIHGNRAQVTYSINGNAYTVALQISSEVITVETARPSND